MKPTPRVVSYPHCTLALVVAALAGACSTEPPSPTTITITPSLATLDLAEELQLAAVVRDQNGQVMTDVAVTWHSDLNSIASVTDGGLVTSVVAGETWVHATVGTATEIVVVVVVPGPRGWLLKAFDELNGSDWTESANWGTTAPLTEWYGVTTDAEGNVTGLTLADNRLAGTIPSELGMLTSLEFLDLSGNLATGLIPRELGNLWNLESLRLDRNRLTGPIPAELGNLENLQRLGLADNDLSGPIPSELGNLRQLEYLVLGYNQLEGPIPPQLGNLRELVVLTLSSNDLTGAIPSELGNLRNLTWLDVGGPGRLTGRIPVELGNLRKLERLHLNGHQLTGEIPPELGNLENLRDLFLGGNKLTGSIPPGLGDLRNLRRLALHFTSLTGPIPPEFGNLGLELLWVNHSTLSGRLPSELVGMPLESFFWGDSGLCAPLDDAFQTWLRRVGQRGGPKCSS